MLTIKNWCLPGDLSEDQLKVLHNSIVEAVVSISEVGVRDERDMLNLFPSDMMSYGLGSEVVVEITGFPRKADCNKAVRTRLAEAVVTAVKSQILGATVKCTVYSPDADAGRWAQLSEARQFEQECEEGLHK